MFEFASTLAVEVVENPDFIFSGKGASRAHAAFFRVYTVAFFLEAENIFPGVLGALVKGGTYGTDTVCL